MKQLTVEEVRKVIERHPNIRMHMIPLDTGVVVEDTIWLIPNAEGELEALDMAGVEEIFHAGR